MRYVELFEVAGTYGFFRPMDDREVLVPHGDHGDYIAEHPEEFGITTADVAAITAQPFEHDSASPGMWRMRRLINLVLHKGWVRVNYYRGAWFFNGRDLKVVRAALRHYFKDDWMDEAVLDVGPDSGEPEWSTSLYPHDNVKQYVRTGKIASGN